MSLPDFLTPGSRFHVVLWWRLLLVLLLTGFICRALPRLDFNVSDVYQWLPDSSPRLESYQWFERHFGSDATLLATWPGCTSEDARLPQFKQQLLVPENLPLIAGVTTGPEVLEQLTRPGTGLSPQAARQRLRGTLFGTDTETTALIITLTPQGQRRRVEALEAVFAASRRTPGLHESELKLAGEAYGGYVAQQAIEDGLLKSSVVAGVFTIIVAWFCLRNLKAVCIILVFASFCSLLSLALVPAAGMRVDGLMTTLPTLIYVLAVSGCIHLFNYLQAACRNLSPEQAGQPAAIARGGFRHAWKPTVVSFVTTALGMLSLQGSQFPAIRQFAFFSAAGTLCMLALLLLIAPGMLAWSVRPGTEEFPLPAAIRQFLGLCLGVGRGYPRTVLTLSLGLTLLLGCQLPRIQPSVSVENHFRSDSRLIRDLRWIEQQIGPFTSCEVVVRFPENDKAGFYNRLLTVRDIERRIQQLPEVTGAYSAATSVPYADEMAGGVIAWRMLSYQLAQTRDEILQGPYLAEEDGQELWRITVRVDEIQNLDLDQFEATLQQTVASELAATGQADSPPLVTGLRSLFQRSQSGIIEDLLESYLLAFVTVAGVMALMLRGVRAGLASMYPNVFPSVIVFGTIALLGGEFDFSTIVTGSIALGIAVDDTTHFLIRYRERRLGLPPAGALEETFQECSAAILTTMLVCCGGFVAFLFSPLATQERFARAIICMMSVAVLGDLLIVPAMLSSRLGQRMLEPRTRKPPEEPAPGPPG